MLKYETITAEEIDYLIEHGSLDEYKEQQQRNAMNSVEPEVEKENTPSTADTQQQSQQEVSSDESTDVKEDSNDDK